LGEVGADPENAEHTRLEPEQRVQGLHAFIQAVQQGRGQFVKALLSRSTLDGTSGNVAGIRGTGKSPEIMPEMRTGPEGDAFTRDVEPLSVSGVKGQFAGVAEVVLSKESTLGTLGSLEGGCEFPEARCQPRDHV